MSAILSADDLNDFISPGVACIKPVETLPLQKPKDLDVRPGQSGSALSKTNVFFCRTLTKSPQRTSFLPSRLHLRKSP